MGVFKFWPLVAGKAGYIGACLAAAIILVVGGYAHGLIDAADSLAGGANLGTNVSPASAQNILLMGLESRTDFKGQSLTAAQFTETHAGKAGSAASAGSQDTDTLILVHIFAGGKKAVGYSIPRDDVVNFPHTVTVNGVVLNGGKIDAAYADAYNQYLDDNHTTQSGDALYKGANQAGQLFETETVESVTGVHIDNFVVSNIIGFYSIAVQLGGISVCLAAAPASAEPAGKGFVTGSNLIDLPYHGAPLSASNSGFDAFKDGYNEQKHAAQYLHLSAAQSLAFVRARDSLPGVDIGRTARQQAAIDYIMYDLRHKNILSDPGTITSLVNSASSFVQVNQGFQLIQFAPQMQAMTGQHLSMHTLPDAAVNNIYVPGLGNGQDANYIYTPNIQQMVNDGFYGSQAVKATKSISVDVYNGSGAPGLAGEVSQDFAQLGYTSTKTGNTAAQSRPVQADTQVFYGAGAENNANSIAALVGESSGPAALSSLPANTVEVLLGSQVNRVPGGLLTYGADGVTGQLFVAAAQQDGLPANEMPSAADVNSPATQSVSASEIGVSAATSNQATAAGKSAAAQSTAEQTAEAQTTVAELTALMQAAAPAQSSAASGSGPTTSSTYTGPRAANVPAGIPCVY